MSVITSLIAANWQAIAGIFAAIAGATGLYLKGRGDAKAKAKNEDLTNANQIRKDGADARERAAADGLRDDGFRRD